MKKATAWSLLITVGVLPVLLAGINKATPNDPTADATKFADALFGEFGQWAGAIFMLVAVAILASWAFSYDGGGF